MAKAKKLLVKLSHSLNTTKGLFKAGEEYECRDQREYDGLVLNGYGEAVSGDTECKTLQEWQAVDLSESEKKKLAKDKADAEKDERAE